MVIVIHNFLLRDYRTAEIIVRDTIAYNFGTPLVYVTVNMTVQHHSKTIFNNARPHVARVILNFIGHNEINLLP